MLKRIYFVLFFVSAYTISFSQNTIVLQDSTTKNISANIQFFEDISGELTVEDVLSKEFKPNGKNHFLLPFSNNAHWIKLEFENKLPKTTDWVLHFKNEITEHLELYEESNGHFQQTKTWNLLTSKTQSFKGQEPFFNLSIEKNKTVFVRIKTRRAIYSKLLMYSKGLQAATVLNDYGQRSFVNGLLIFRLMLVLTLGLFIIKIIPFRAYSGLVLIKTLGYWGLVNIIGPSFTDSPELAAKINFLFYAITPISTIIFSLIILPLNKLTKLYKYGLYAFLALAVIMQCMVQINYDPFNLKFGTLVLALSGFYILVLYAISIYKKLPIQRYYSIPFLLGLTSYVLMNVRILLQTEIKGVSVIAFGLFVAEILVFIFFLGKIFRDNTVANYLTEQKLQNQLKLSEKLQELNSIKTSFFTNISHELKTPLTLIAGPVDSLLKKYPEEGLLKLLKPNVTRLRQLIDQILDIQKLEAGKQAPDIISGDLAKHLRLEIQSYESMAEAKKIKLQYVQEKEEVFGYYDEDKLNKIIGNLISNAIKYSDENTTVEVRVSFPQKGSQLHLSVIDKGYGIAKEDLPHIFDRFYQVNNKKKSGSGVGLALVKELISLLNGSIKVKSELEKGTQFDLQIPIDYETWKGHLRAMDTDSEAVKTESVHTQEEAFTFESRVDNTQKDIILIVEDNRDMQEYLKFLLHEKYEVLQAFNGEQGLAMAKEEVPDIVLCDLMMPKLDGFGFTKGLREEAATSHIPVIMLTAKSSKESRIEGFETGIDQYLTKPFDAEELQVILRKSLDTRKYLRQFFGGETQVAELIPKISQKENLFIEEIRAYLENNYHLSGLSIADISENLKMSDTQLRRKLKNLSDYTPVEYLRKFRLEKAKEKLESGNKSVSEVAFEVGYENLSYFSKVFQQEFNKLPSDLL